MIPINSPKIGNEEIDAAAKVLKSGILTNSLGAGPMVTQFEKAYAEFVNAKHAIAVNSGTAALQLAVAAAGIKPGDEVILPSFTFVATAEVIVAIKAKPIFVDIDPETYNISIDGIEKAITKNTKAIVPVDLYGLPADMKPIREIADEHGLKVVEDAAQAHGASYMGKSVGAFADAACWSFYASKNMTTGEGGMITTNDDYFAEKARLMRSHGEAEKYKSIMLGYNYRMPEIEAAIGYVQLMKLPKFLAKRRENASTLLKNLGNVGELRLPEEPKGYRHSWNLFTVRLKKSKKGGRDRILHELRMKGIGAEVYYPNPIHLMPFYKRLGAERLPETEAAAKQVFSLPVHPGVTKEHLDLISESVLSLLRQHSS